MQFYASVDDVPRDFGPSAVTIGKFDGVHTGHRAVIRTLKGEAESSSLVSTVLTFDRHPLALLDPQRAPAGLTTNTQKREVLEGTGIDAVVMIQFTRQFSQLSPQEFVDTVLVDALHAKLVFVGSDFRFGRGGAGTVDLLRELGETRGFSVRIIDAVKPDGERAISSTWIRDLMSAGRVRDAAALLERRPSVRGIVVRGEQRGRELGYPTANLSADLEGLIPADGVYAAYATVGGTTYPAAVSIGNNPTFDGVADKQVEAHLLDVTIDLYGQTLDVSFVDYVRGMEKFDGIEPLIAQMTVDEAEIRRILGVPDPRASAGADSATDTDSAIRSATDPDSAADPDSAIGA